MGASATARLPGRGEHQKARYRLLVCGILAFLGPPAFGIPVGFFSALFSITLIAYGLWALRLTVIFHDDESLGLLLALFDVALTMPFLVWGSHAWMGSAVGILWAATILSAFVVWQRGRTECGKTPDSLVDPGSGLYVSGCLPEAVRTRVQSQGERAGLGLVLVRIHRLPDYRSFFGPEAADRLVGAVVRRSLRALGPEAEGFRLGQDTAVFLVSPGASFAGTSFEVAEAALEVSRAVGSRLIDGRRADVAVGYAVAPRDGATARELVQAALELAFDGSSRIRTSDRRIVVPEGPAAPRTAPVLTPQEVAGSGAAVG